MKAGGSMKEKKDEDVWMEFVKAVLKPGYLYGVGEDNELYCIEVPIPKPGESVTMTLQMPEKYRYGN